MSKVVAIQFLIQDLHALSRACARLGLEFIRDQHQYRWYGNRGQNEAVPEGFTREELGTCEHVIRVPNNAQAYEIGVVTRRDGLPGYMLLWDSYNGGFGLTNYVGEGAQKLLQAYSLEVTLDQFAQVNHHLIDQQTAENGALILTFAQ
jgi:hypothetical protein